MSAQTFSDPMFIVGRREERDRIVSLALAPAERGLVVIGDCGTGKTRLLEAAAAEAPIKSVLIRTNPSESELPLSGFSAVLASVGDPRAFEFGSRFGLPTSEPRELFAAARDVLALLRELRIDPHLVLIDDADLMDAESRLLLGFMAGRLAGSNLRLVVSARSDGSSSAFGGYESLTLGPLSEEDSRELAARVIGPAEPGTLQILASRSAGIPIVIVENARALNEEQAWGAEPLVLPFKPGTHTRPLEQLPPMSPAARRTLDNVALGPLARIAALADLGESDADTLDALIETDLVTVHGRYLRLADPLLRSQLYWAMEATDRRQRHEELAHAYADLDPYLATWHASFSSPHDDAQVRALLTAAVDLVQQGERDAPVDFAERALRLSTSFDQIAETMLDLTEALLKRGELDLASRYLEYTRQKSPNPESTVRLATIGLTMVYARTWVVPDIDIETTVDVHATTDPAGTVGLLDLAAICHGARWEFRAARASLDRAASILSGAEIKAPELHGQAQRLLDVLDDPASAHPGDDEQPPVPVADAPPEELLTYGMRLMHSEQYDRARRVFALTATRAHVAEPIWHESALYLAACNEIAAGNVNLGRMLVDEWTHIGLTQVAPRSSRVFLRAWHAAVTDNRDNFAALSLECLERASAENNQAVTGALFALQGTLALLERDDDGALRLLEFADRANADVRNPALLRHAADLVEVQVSLGRVAEARRVREALKSWYGSRPSRWLALALERVEANLAPEHDRIAAVRACVDSYAPSDSPYELAKTLANLARRHDDAGDTDESRKAYAVARSAFERAGAPSLAQLLLVSEAERMPPVASSITGLLTNEERQIADLVCQGLRNKEIAAQMFLSLRSVEAKLTLIYRKVNARTRSHLVAMLTEVAR